MSYPSRNCGRYPENPMKSWIPTATAGREWQIRPIWDFFSILLKNQHRIKFLKHWLTEVNSHGKTIFCIYFRELFQFRELWLCCSKSFNFRLKNWDSALIVKSVQKKQKISRKDAETQRSRKVILCGFSASLRLCVRFSFWLRAQWR